MNNEEEQAYRNLEATASKIADDIGEFDVQVLQSPIPEEVKLRILEWNQGYRSLAYFLHPQPEWTGGDSSKINPPHIAKSPCT